MPSRRSVLATSGTALATALAGCSSLGMGSDGGDGPNRSGLNRWLTEAVADVGTQEPVMRTFSGPGIRHVRTAHPIRAAAIDALSEEAMELITSYDVEASVSLPMAQVESLTEVDTAVIANGGFDAPSPPDGLTETGQHRGARLYHVQEDSSEGPIESPVDGYAIGDGIVVVLPAQPTPDAATAGLRTLLNVNAGSGTSIDADGQIDRIRSYLTDGFFERYYAQAARDREGLSLHAEGDVVHSRSIQLLPTESDARQVSGQIEEWVSNERASGEDRGYRDFSPYETVDVRRDGRAVKTVGTLPASAVAFPEFASP